MANFFTGGVLRPVYNMVGKNADGSRKLRRCNFDILKWDSNGDGIAETYVNTGIGMPISGLDFADTATDWEYGTVFGFYEDGYDVVEPHGWKYPDTVLGLHCFGYY